MFCFAKQKLLITSDNNEYPVTALSRASTQIRFRFATANFGYSDTLAEIFLFFFGLSPNCFKKFLNFFFIN